MNKVKSTEGILSEMVPEIGNVINLLQCELIEPLITQPLIFTSLLNWNNPTAVLYTVSPIIVVSVFFGAFMYYKQ